MRVIFNPEFCRYEVYREEPIVRNGQPQPIFVSHDEKQCRKFIHRVEEQEARR